VPHGSISVKQKFNHKTRTPKMAAKKTRKTTRKRKTTTRKARRSPAQRAATRKLVALNRKRAGRKTATKRRTRRK
jgi:hypothetical protein